MVAWLVLFPALSAETLEAVQEALLIRFRRWYMYVVAVIFIACAVLTLWPGSGRVRLGPDDEKPAYSTLSWLSMMFCSGIGAGIVFYSVAEPMAHFQQNPEIHSGTLDARSPDALVAALKYSILHWGLSAWACYAIVGLGLAFFSYRYNLPLTTRTAIAPLLGRALSGPVGHMVDIFSIVAIVVGVAITVGYGAGQLAFGAHFILGFDGILAPSGMPTISATLIALSVVSIITTISVASGVGRGIKWMSNASTLLFFTMMGLFVWFGEPLVIGSALITAIRDYLVQLPGMLMDVRSASDTVSARISQQLQTDWTIFYWTWWIAFGPFVGLFLARVSRGRTIREFLLGAVLVPCVVCMAWFAFMGGTAIQTELSGRAGGAIMNSAGTAQLFAAIDVLMPEQLVWYISLFTCVLVLMLLITTLSAGILAINTIAAAGDSGRKKIFHVFSWSAAVTTAIGGLLVAGGTSAIRDAMVIGALPFSVVMVLITISIFSELFRVGGTKRRS